MQVDAVARRRYRLVLAVSVPFALGWAVVIFGGVGGPTFAKWFSNGALACAALAAGASCGITAFRSRGRYRTVWTLLALGMASWGVGQVIWDYYEVVLRQEVPFPSWADAGYLAELPFVVAALVRLPSGTRSMAGRTRTVLDGLIVAAAFLLISWMLVLGKVFHGGLGRLIPPAVSRPLPLGAVGTVPIRRHA